MTAARLDHRGTQKEIIAAQEREIAALKAQVASLQRELEAIRSVAKKENQFNRLHQTRDKRV